jgi:hypothetical protein
MADAMKNYESGARQAQQSSHSPKGVTTIDLTYNDDSSLIVRNRPKL